MSTTSSPQAKYRNPVWGPSAQPLQGGSDVLELAQPFDGPVTGEYPLVLKYAFHRVQTMVPSIPVRQLAKIFSLLVFVAIQVMGLKKADGQLPSLRDVMRISPQVTTISAWNKEIHDLQQYDFEKRTGGGARGYIISDGGEAAGMKRQMVIGYYWMAALCKNYNTQVYAHRPMTPFLHPAQALFRCAS